MAIEYLTPILEKNNKLQHLTNLLLEFREQSDEKLEATVALFRANHDNEDLEKEINKIRHQLIRDKKNFERNIGRRDFYTKRSKDLTSQINTNTINLTNKTNLVKTLEIQLTELIKQKQETESNQNDDKNSKSLKKKLNFLKKRIDATSKSLDRENNMIKKISSNLDTLKESLNQTLKDLDRKLRELERIQKIISDQELEIIEREKLIEENNQKIKEQNSTD